MIEVSIPGFRDLQLHHLVVDFNGTLALDGRILPGVGEALTALAAQLKIHVLTSDTCNAASQVDSLPVQLTITPKQSQAEAKLAYVTDLGSAGVVAIGNGRNDRKMLEASALGITLIQKEGAAAESVASADLVSNDILSALELLRNPRRLLATLRS
jgi:soluble P-type ATPase